MTARTSRGGFFGEFGELRKIAKWLERTTTTQNFRESCKPTRLFLLPINLRLNFSPTKKKKRPMAGQPRSIERFFNLHIVVN